MRALAFITRHKNKPFCLLLMYNAPHAPDHVTNRYLSKVGSIKNAQRRQYAALVQGVDAGVGKVRTTLDELGLAENTMVVFVSDNGGRRGSADNRPLRGNKGWLHEGGIRVPFIISWPGTLPENTTYTKPVITLDLLPTAMAAAGIPLPEGIDGIDLRPYLSGENKNPPHETLYWRVCGGKGYAIRHNNWKLVHDVGMNQPMLYNLADDLAEDKDLMATHIEQHRRLRSMYLAWADTLENPRWKEGHEKNASAERAAAIKAGTRQFPMPWAAEDRNP